MTTAQRLGRRSFCLCCLGAGAGSLMAGEACAGLSGKEIVETIIAESGKATSTSTAFAAGSRSWRGQAATWPC